MALWTITEICEVGEPERLGVPMELITSRFILIKNLEGIGPVPSA